MTFSVTALYTYQPTFNLTHYATHHMPLAMERMRPYGFQSYQIIPLQPTNATAVQYGVQCNMFWDSEQGMREGFAAHGAEMDADLHNFSDSEPVGILGNIYVTASTY